ncbi:MAG: DUF3000 domain-containing protein [Hamadaea sp.]|uniref:DUF3000 domain-containing protein n=1 Tax=Hamadaea sp. TaxID=2024425 RepID=UPI0017DD05E6|nr:DUF3000 domain-containing protein [Hamadaea sp.]NUR72541.1 DUF3000 domain-containing protein [Hamadaea sp.]NUT22917.1 DUF3000 domain-containing protein [Hamadaea sp.]
MPTTLRTPPDVFTRAVEALRSAAIRREISLEEVGAPTRLAPYAHALGATVLRDGEEVATGRLILLHDPAGHEAWHGTMRLVTYVTAELEPEYAADPLLPQVGWSWLVDALDAHTGPGREQGYTAIAGTVTQTLSTRFGDLARVTEEEEPPGSPTAADLEIRASWTPLGPNLDDHMLAWCTLLASTAGLPPEGVTALPNRRRES